MLESFSEQVKHAGRELVMISTLYLVALSSDGLGLRAGWVGRVLGRSDRCLTKNNLSLDKARILSLEYLEGWMFLFLGDISNR